MRGCGVGVAWCRSALPAPAGARSVGDTTVTGYFTQQPLDMREDFSIIDWIRCDPLSLFPSAGVRLVDSRCSVVVTLHLVAVGEGHEVERAHVALLIHDRAAACGREQVMMAPIRPGTVSYLGLLLTQEAVVLVWVPLRVAGDPSRAPQHAAPPMDGPG